MPFNAFTNSADPDQAALVRGTWVNSEDPGEMSQHDILHQCLCCVLGL